MNDRLSQVEEYISLAENALDLAQLAPDAERKQAIIGIARTWIGLATSSFEVASPPELAERFRKALVATSASGSDGPA